MGKNFDYRLLGGWFRADEDRDRPELACLLPHQKLILLSDGSLTLDLELLYNSMVSVEVKFKGATPLSKEAASYIEEDPGENALEREVWLTVDNRRLVYAHSLIPASCVEPGLLKSLEKYGDEPLGRVLTTNRIFFTKEKLEIGFVKCACASSDLGIPQETPLTARRYMLINRKSPGRFIIKALITEVFSPEVVYCAFMKGSKAAKQA